MYYYLDQQADKTVEKRDGRNMNRGLVVDGLTQTRTHSTFKDKLSTLQPPFCRVIQNPPSTHTMPELPDLIWLIEEKIEQAPKLNAY